MGSKAAGFAMTDSLFTNAIASAAAGCVGRICTHPLDVAKARIQYIDPSGAQNLPYKGTLDVLRRTARTEGIKGLYRGFGAVIVGGVPATMLYLCSYDLAKERLTHLSGADGGNLFAVHFTAGMIAESISCIVFVPVDVIKERMQVQHPISDKAKASGMLPNYRNSLDALQQISRHEGLSGIYRGYGATLASFGPFSALYFVFFEDFKYRIRNYLGESQHAEIPFQWLVCSSASAGALAAWITSPIDMAKLRLQ